MRGSVFVPYIAAMEGDAPGAPTLTLGDLVRDGLQLLVWCNVCRRPTVTLDPGPLAARLGATRPVYGVWRALRCDACQVSGQVLGNLYSMPSQPTLHMGLGGTGRGGRV